MTALTLHEIVDAADDMVGPVLALYREAFPSNERKPDTFLATVIDRSDYMLLVAVSGSTPVGMAVVYQSPLGFALLEYMAIERSARGGGYGSSLFEAISARATSPTVLEVESERPGNEGALDRARRISFYRRLGCRTIAGLDYLMPQVSYDPPPPMILMVNGDAQDLDRSSLCNWLDDIYRHVYNRRDDDPGLAIMHRAVKDPVSLV